MVRKSVAVWAKEIGISIPDFQPYARKASVPASRGATLLNELQVVKVRRELAKERTAEQKHRSNSPGMTIYQEHRPAVSLTTQSEQRPECRCCRLTVAMGADVAAAQLCKACESHYETPDEPLSRRIARLSDHERRMTEADMRAREFADQARAQRDSAFKSRDSWKRVAVMLTLDHEDNGKGRCSRCNAAFPCRAWKLLEELNIGCHRATERLAGFSDTELERHLSPVRRREVDYVDIGLDEEDEYGEGHATV
jgi:hypothetical protein